MVALASLLVVVLISIIAVRIGAVALTMTGVSKDMAMFQAQSAFSGTGFTTRESEAVVSNRTRRNIVRLLMLMGNAGLTSVVATLVLTFVGGTQLDAAMRLGGILVGLLLLWLIASSKVFDLLMTRAVKAALARWTSLDIQDYAKVLEIAKGYTVSEITMEPSHWACDHALRELRVNAEGIIVLGVRKPGVGYIGAATGDTQVKVGDTLTCYGREKLLREFSVRRKGPEGDARHEAAIAEQRQTLQKQREQIDR